jgi:hypothetical protein
MTTVAAGVAASATVSARIVIYVVDPKLLTPAH